MMLPGPRLMPALVGMSPSCTREGDPALGIILGKGLGWIIHD